MPEPPWSRVTGVESVVVQWLSSGKVKPCLAASELIPEQHAERVAIPAALPSELRQALAGRGIGELYTHQAEAVENARRGRHVVVATPTASGKSLCFHLPVLAGLAEDPGATALYLYPTKALSRDQEHGIRALAADAELDIGATVYDGDTPGDTRRAARQQSRIVLTNPDMLHAGILPNHSRWASLFRGLRYVVLDELHTYRGVFGSHMAHVLARLGRICRFHGSAPTFICGTATIGNPLEHATRLLGVPMEDIHLVDRSGAPSAPRQLFVYNPPVVNEQLGLRASSLKHAVSLAADLVRARVPTIVFGQSRNTVEVMLKYLRDECHGVVPADSIMGYRGGYLPNTRRNIEAGLRNGEILCVAATNALELGIDIGDLDAVVCVGYPGSIAATWQRFGRAGRRGSRSIALLVCSSGAIDQFLAQEPEYLLRTRAEQARIDPNNVEILIQHMKCAAFEAPFALSSPGENVTRPAPALGESYATLDSKTTREALEYLCGLGLVHPSRNRYHWVGDPYPATHVSLRNVGWDNFVIIDLDSGKTLAELDWRAAHTMLHEQAIYQHDAEQFQVERLDYDDHKAFVRKVEPDYFTTALTYRTVEVLDENAIKPFGPHLGPGQAVVGWGEVKVVEKVTGYKKVKFFTHENTGYGDVHLPEIEMHTTSFWLTVPDALIDDLGIPRARAVDALRSAGTALETVATLALMCEPSDIGRTLGDGAEQAEGRSAGRNPFSGRTGALDPTIFLFDAVPGGVGLAQRIFEQAETLVRAARSLIQSCSCDAGCPACVGPVTGQGATARTPGRKGHTLALLARLQPESGALRASSPHVTRGAENATSL
jgi:DEAD/DEAH box helicase domain-containing protein